MAPSNPYFHYRDFKKALAAVDPALIPDALAALEAAERTEREAKGAWSAAIANRLGITAEILKTHVELLKPHMRPCHRRDANVSWFCVRCEDYDV